MSWLEIMARAPRSPESARRVGGDPFHQGSWIGTGATGKQCPPSFTNRPGRPANLNDGDEDSEIGDPNDRVIRSGGTRELTSSASSVSLVCLRNSSRRCGEPGFSAIRRWRRAERGRPRRSGGTRSDSALPDHPQPESRVLVTMTGPGLAERSASPGPVGIRERRGADQRPPNSRKRPRRGEAAEASPIRPLPEANSGARPAS